MEEEINSAHQWIRNMQMRENAVISQSNLQFAQAQSQMEYFQFQVAHRIQHAQQQFGHERQSLIFPYSLLSQKNLELQSKIAFIEGAHQALEEQ